MHMLSELIDLDIKKFEVLSNKIASYIYSNLVLSDSIYFDSNTDVFSFTYPYLDLEEELGLSLQLSDHEALCKLVDKCLSEFPGVVSCYCCDSSFYIELKNSFLCDLSLSKVNCNEFQEGKKVLYQFDIRESALHYIGVDKLIDLLKSCDWIDRWFFYRCVGSVESVYGFSLVINEPYNFWSISNLLGFDFWKCFLTMSRLSDYDFVRYAVCDSFGKPINLENAYASFDIKSFLNIKDGDSNEKK